MGALTFKGFLLDKEEIQIIHLAKKENGLSTEVAALRFILNAYRNQKTEKDLIKEALGEYVYEHRDFTERLRWATRIAEQNTIMMIDAINTMLVEQNITECIPIEIYESPVIGQSRSLMKDKINYFKQKKDERKRKKKERQD